ncbi:MAG: ABC transporter permease [Bacilli bacterium]|jgi:ABC-2 type transport system permease protein|nr:ABC transporter permease [Bacilli bacterium]
MKTKLKFLIKQSLDKKMKTKWFKVANILIAICIIGIANIDRIITLFGGDFEEKREIVVLDQLGKYDIFEQSFHNIATSVEEMKNFEIKKSNDSLDKITKELNQDNDQIIIVLKQDPNEYITTEMISFDPVDTITYQLVLTALNQVKSSIVLETSGLSANEIMSLTSPVNILKTVTNEEAKNAESKDMISSGLILVFIVPFFFLITMLTQMIGAEINDEKSTRGMEIIISNVSPKIHFISKITASTLFVLIQGLLLIVYSIAAYVIRGLLSATGVISVSGEIAETFSSIWNTVVETGILELLLKGLPFILILFIVSFLLYAILAGVLASMTTSIEDYQQLQTPLMIILLVGYYIAIMASQFDGAIFVKIVSYIPMLSFLVAPVIYMLGQTALWELGLSTIISIGFCILFFYYGLRIYKVGILNYSSSKLWKKIFKSMHQKN